MLSGQTVQLLGRGLLVCLVAGAALFTGNAALAVSGRPAPDSGQAAGGTTVTMPAPVAGPFTQVSTGDAFAVAIGSDGHSYAWGKNDYGQLGDGTTDESTAPVRIQVPTGVTFTQISAGGSSALALDAAGNAYAWGSNESAQLGNGSNDHDNHPLPVRVPAPAPGVTYTWVSVVSSYSRAVGSDGKVYAWGRNSEGQVGNESTPESNVPVPVRLPPGQALPTSSVSTSISGTQDSNGGQGGGSLPVTGAGSILPFAITGGITLLLAGTVVVTVAVAVRVRACRNGPDQQDHAGVVGASLRCIDRKTGRRY